MTSEGTGEAREGNQSCNLLAIWSNWLFAVFAGWEAEHILYGLSCYGGWSHPPILDPCCWSPWLRAPFPCLAFLWSPWGCTPPLPPMLTAGGTARGETCLANSRAPSGRRRPQIPPSSPPCLRLHLYPNPARTPSPSGFREQRFIFLQGHSPISMIVSGQEVLSRVYGDAFLLPLVLSPL